MSALLASKFTRAVYHQDIADKGFSIWSCESKEEFLSILYQVGEPNGHDAQGNILWDVKPSRIEDGPRSHRFDEFTFHTDASFESDPPSGIALYVVRADRFGGGKTRLVDWWKVRERLSADSLCILQQPVEIQVPAEFRKLGVSTHASILLNDGGIRYRRELIKEEQICKEMITALNEVDQLLSESSFQIEFQLYDRQAIFIDNRRLLHARTAVKDPERYLIRARYS
jgi:alpha-ketoglutarate-dependent taurine dioxygenase